MCAMPTYTKHSLGSPQGPLPNKAEHQQREHAQNIRERRKRTKREEEEEEEGVDGGNITKRVPLCLTGFDRRA